MRYARTAKADANLLKNVEMCIAEGPVVITKDGKNVAVLISPADEAELERLVLAYSPGFQAMLERSRQSVRNGEALTHDEFWKAVEERHQAKERMRPSASKKKSKSK
jgi:prevent-host-death family protein